MQFRDAVRPICRDRSLFHDPFERGATIMAIAASMSSPEIGSRLRELLGSERNTKVDFLLHLDAFDRAEGYDDLGYATLWDYLHRELGLLGCAIFFRTQSMELLRRFPQIEAYLRDGRLYMTSLVKLKDAITEEN